MPYLLPLVCSPGPAYMGGNNSKGEQKGRQLNKQAGREKVIKTKKECHRWDMRPHNKLLMNLDNRALYLTLFVSIHNSVSAVAFHNSTFEQVVW